MALQRPHLPDVVLAGHTMDNASGSQEKQSLEEGVGHKMEDRRSECANSECGEHVSELTDRRVGQDPLDVVLYQADRGGKESRGDPYDSHHRKDEGRHEVEGATAGNHVDASGDHGGCMDEGAHGGWPLHGVREPDV